MSEKQAKGIEEQEKLTQVEEVQAVKEEKRKPENKKCIQVWRKPLMSRLNARIV